MKVEYTHYTFLGRGVHRETIKRIGKIVHSNSTQYKILDVETGCFYWRIKDNVNIL